jgi:D-sedoheptulose 7-phosphate isomerase
MRADVTPLHQTSQDDSDSGDAAAFAADYLRRSAEVLAQIDPAEIAAIIEALAAARLGGHGIFVCGNGGSAATTSHFAAGLGKDASSGRPARFRAMALTDNVPWITSLANDSDYSKVFVEQLINHAVAGDLLVAFSASGNSANVLEAVRWARDNDLVTIGVTSRDGGALAGLCRHVVRVDTDHVGHVEEGHFLVQHLITYFFVERP